MIRFDLTEPTPGNHVELLAKTSLLVLLSTFGRVVDDRELAEVIDRHRVVTDYLMRPPDPTGLADDDAIPDVDAWLDAVTRWETAGAEALPLLRLDRAGLTDLPSRLALMLAAQVDQDARLAELFDAVQRPLPGRRPNVQTIASCLRFMGSDNGGSRVRELIDAGLLACDQTLDVVGDRPVRVPEPFLPVLAGVAGDRPATPATDPCLDEATIAALDRAAAAMAEGYVEVVVVRGPAGSDREAAADRVVSAIGLGAIRSRAAGPDLRLPPTDVAIAVAVAGCPVIDLDPLPGQTIVLPAGTATPVVVTLGPDGGLDQDSMTGAVVVELPRLGPELRRRRWTAALDGNPAEDLDEIVERFHLPGRTIATVAAAARTAARVEGGDPVDGRVEVQVGVDHVRLAIREEADRRLQPLADRLPPVDDHRRLVVDDATARVLDSLQRRCRHRERLAETGPSGGGIGVRALFSGPSGTGKTLAARVLAARLGVDVYRLDLAAVFDKYVGETEKNLHRVLSVAEQLDVVLLVDEGDSLFGGRTEVRSANDRYANLETNYLLQRIESYDGIIVVTTNARGSIDAAFERRMDVSITFPRPAAAERHLIWRAHLPDQGLGDDLLRELARDHALTGGQIENAAQSAWLAALDEPDAGLTADHLRHAVLVEYRKAGVMAPDPRPGPDPVSMQLSALMDPR